MAANWKEIAFTREKFKPLAALGLDGVHVMVPFEIAYSLRDLPGDILTKDAKDIVSFDEKSNAVTFDLGTIKVTTHIPE